jgi:hypothetical protein
MYWEGKKDIKMHGKDEDHHDEYFCGNKFG